MRSNLLALIALLAMSVSATALATPIATGLYVLGDHPDGNAGPPMYGLRLDGLGAGPFTFSFEANSASVFMDYDAAAGTAHIFGTAWGGEVVANSWISPTSWAIDFNYSGLSQCDAVGTYDDVCANAVSGNATSGATGNNTGTIENLSTNVVTSLVDYTSGSHFPLTFQFGDETNGHRGFAGLSGWGWLGIGTPNNFQRTATQDWLFTAKRVPVPEPGTLLLMGSMLIGLGFRRMCS